MDLILVRHGQPERVHADTTDGRPADPGLTLQGRMEAKRVAEWLRHEHVDHIVSSPMLRALQTSEPLADARGLEPEILDDLAEYDRHAAHYTPFEQMSAEEVQRLAEAALGSVDLNELANETYAGSHVEEIGEFAGRVVAAVEGIIERNEDHRVVAFCHGGVINAYLAHIIGLDRQLWFYPEYASLHRVSAAAGLRMITTLNEIPRV
ncbi:MAG: histidine phosphatase family protein [Acidimicrobiia bacterium]